MALYELRTYTLRVGAMAEAVKLYQELGFPALQKGGQDQKLVGYFQTDTGTINQLVDTHSVGAICNHNLGMYTVTEIAMENAGTVPPAPRSPRTPNSAYPEL